MDVDVYEIGQLVRCEAKFFDADDRALDPAVVILEITNPNGVLTSYTYPVGILKDAVGQYHYDQDANLAGLWKQRWHSTGNGQAAQRGEFIVESA